MENVHYHQPEEDDKNGEQTAYPGEQVNTQHHSGADGKDQGFDPAFPGAGSEMPEFERVSAHIFNSEYQEKNGNGTEKDLGDMVIHKTEPGMHEEGTGQNADQQSGYPAGSFIK